MARRSATVSLGLTALVASALTGCSSTARPMPLAASSSGMPTLSPPSSIDPPPPSDVLTDDATDEITDAPADPDYGAVCVDEASGVRVDDSRCSGIQPVVGQHASGGHGTSIVGWYFLSRALSAPPVGRVVSGGTYTTPSTWATGGVPRSGGSVSSAARAAGSSRGGFGATSAKASS